MFVRLALAVCLSVSLSAMPMAQAQNGPPTVAIVQFGFNVIVGFVEAGLTYTLNAYGFIADDELGDIEEGNQTRSAITDPHLENLNFHYFDADYNFAALQAQVDAALDLNPDVIFAIEEVAALAVVNATANMEDPPAVLFAAVPDPYLAGLAEASCLKPAHVSGTHSELPYDEILPMYLKQDPDLDAIGVVFSQNEGSSAAAAQEIAAAGEALGWRVELAGAIGFADLALATGGLISREVDAILLPNMSHMFAAQPIVIDVASEAGLPVYSIGVDAPLYVNGGMIGVSFNQWYTQGVNLGLIAVAILDGELDASQAGISAVDPIIGLSVNEQYAAHFDIELSQEVLEAADVRLAQSGLQFQTERSAREFAKLLLLTPLEARQEADQAFIESIRCTPEMIAEQQAELGS